MPTKLKFKPTPADVQVEDAVLTNIAVARLQDPGRFFAAKLFKFVPVQLQGGKFPVWSTGDVNRDTMTQREPGEEYPISIVRLGRDNYFCDPIKDSVLIPDEVKMNAVSSVQIERTYAEVLANKALIRADRAFVTDHVKASHWGTDDTPDEKFDDTGSAKPISFLRSHITNLVKQGVPREWITFAADGYTLDALLDHPQLEDKYQGAQVSNLLDEDIAKILKIGKVVRCESVYASSAEGVAEGSETMGFIWPRGTGLLLCVPPNPGINVPAAGYNFTWSAYSPSNDFGIQVEPLDRRERDAQQLKARTAWDQKLIGAKLGIYLHDLLSAES